MHWDIQFKIATIDLKKSTLMDAIPAQDIL